MEEKTKKDRKIKDKKISIKSSTCNYIAGSCFMLSGLLAMITRETPTIGMIYVSLGFLFMVTAQNARKQEENQASGSEDEKSRCDHQDS